MNSSGTTEIPETSEMSGASAAMVSARLDRLPATAYIWKLIILLSLGGFFEVYDIALTAALSPGLIRARIVHAGVKGLIGFTQQGSLSAVIFLDVFHASVTLD